ncbi:MAG: glycerol-3-phosphate acyltransferase [Chloroflexota bacterium]
MTTEVWKAAASLVAAYLVGSVPTGVVVARLAKGIDVRRMHSGRTGGTNVARSAGFWAGLGTGIGDVLKGAGVVWLARGLTGGIPWVEAAAGALAVLGHNHSIFLLERIDGRLRFSGGAGGAPTMGVALGLWAPTALWVIPPALILLLVVGYASLATLSVGLLVLVTFSWRALAGLGPWEYAAFGAVAAVLLVLALRPNLRRLVSGQERLVGLRARRKPSPGASSSPAGPSPKRRP